MTFSSALTPVEVLTHVLAPNAVVDWHAHLHDEFCLVVDGTPAVGHAGAKVLPDPGTLFLFREGEIHGLWNRGSATSRLWQLDFRITSEARAEFSALFNRPPEQRTVRLSPGRQKVFCDICQKIAFEKSAADTSNHSAASAWLVIQLVSVTRWFSGRTGHGPVKPEENIESAIELKGNLDPQCFDLWQKIYQHAFESACAKPMLFGQDPGHDSLRHRFRKAFGVSPQSMLVRLRMNRAKELLRTSNFSVKEIASQLGYARQHEFARAFHKSIGMSPSEWKVQADTAEQ